MITGPRRIRLPRRLRVPFPGKAFLLITLGVGAAAVNTGNNLLYLALCLNLSLILVSGVLSEGTLRRVTLSIRPASEAFAGEEAFLAVTCSTLAKRFPAMGLTAVLRSGESAVTVRFPDIGPGGSATRIAPFRPARRGRLEPVFATVSTRFPFSLFEKSFDRSIPVRILVYPRPSPPGARGEGPTDASLPDDPFLHGSIGAFPIGTRDHLPSDPVRNIHWKATAHAGRWMVKEREREAGPVVDLRVPETGPEDLFEARVSEACGAVLEFERRGSAYRLRIGDRLCAEAGDPRRRSKALAALAEARAAGDPSSPRVTPP